MFFVYQAGTLFRVQTDGSTVTSSAVVATNLPENIACIAPMGSTTIYYVLQSAPTQVVRLKLLDGSTTNTTLDDSCVQLLSSANKIYCLMATSLSVIDPLCGQVEQFSLPEPMVQIRALSFGFALRAASGNVFTFQFGVDVELTKVLSHALLGQIRRRVVALGAAPGVVALVPLEGAAERQVVALERDGATIVGGCDDSSGSIVLLTREAKLLQMAVDAEGSLRVESLVGFDMKIDVETQLVPASLADPVETCNICLDDISEGEAITLDCGHAFHVDCVQSCLMHAEKYIEAGTKITFNMAMCPGGCGRIVRHAINVRSKAISERYRKVRELATARALSEYPNENPSEVIDKFLYYVCHRCKQPFWGGNKDCAATLGGEPKNDPEALICEGCQTDFACSIHKRDFVVYKCRYCCNPATHLSFGTQRLCDRCHAGKVKEPIPCPRTTGQGACCLAAGHAESGVAAPIGCVACLPATSLDVSKIVPAMQEPK